MKDGYYRFRIIYLRQTHNRGKRSSQWAGRLLVVPRTPCLHCSAPHCSLQTPELQSQEKGRRTLAVSRGGDRSSTTGNTGSSRKPAGWLPSPLRLPVRTRVYQSTHVPHEVPTPPSLCLVEGWLPSEQVGTHPLPMLNHTRKKPGPLFLVCSELAHRQSTAEKDH